MAARQAPKGEKQEAREAVTLEIQEAAARQAPEEEKQEVLQAVILEILEVEVQ